MPLEHDRALPSPDCQKCQCRLSEGASARSKSPLLVHLLREVQRISSSTGLQSNPSVFSLLVTSCWTNQSRHLAALWVGRVFIMAMYFVFHMLLATVSESLSLCVFFVSLLKQTGAWTGARADHSASYKYICQGFDALCYISLHSRRLLWSSTSLFMRVRVYWSFQMRWHGWCN